MKKQRYNTNTNRKRNDGQSAFSARGCAIANQRLTAVKGGRIRRALGEDDTFTDAFKDAFSVKNEHLWILERTHLETEIGAAKKIITALRNSPDDTEAKRLLRKIRSKPIDRKQDCIHCPVWRHEREMGVIDAAVSRYAFPKVRDQLYLVTIVFDFAENIVKLEEKIKEAHQTMDGAIKYMTSRRHGVMITGCLEPDLESKEQLLGKISRRKMLEKFGLQAPDAGGWTITGHFIVRAPHVDLLEAWFKDQLPTLKGWNRVQFKPISEDDNLLKNLVQILGYAGKFPASIFGSPTRGDERKQADENMRRMSAAFNGPAMSHFDAQSFDVSAAIVQWAKFTDRLGAKMMYFSKESVYAQKWHSPSETNYLRKTNDDMNTNGEHRIEIHRDCGPFSHSVVMPHLKGRLRPLRTRELRYDHEWVTMTDCDGIDIDTHYHDFDLWMIKP